ncbi:longitudinals lacking protein isoform X6 [Anastrepha obliqua]|uniref:longitudinals lacking protein isoform X6 n=1 Tax=Anastrepha obliqua TaxID=95512 RepID=UPI00240A79BB|nr:longitudinals lacking protein isoform X6 [Anastrepha obliqua]
MEDDQQFCLRWNNHQSTLISVFDTLLENQTLVDCTLAAEGQFLKAHKVVLSACSPFFADLLQQQYDKHPIFILKDVKYQELRAMMDYMYRGEVNISQDQLAALLKTAESLQIKGLSDNRSGSTPKTEQHRGLNVHGSGSGGKLSVYTLEQTQPKRPRVGPSPMETTDISGSREGSSSPSRRRKKARRKSAENAMSADVHDNSNSSQINQSSLQPHQQQPQANASLTGVGAITAATSSLPVSASALSTGTSGVLAATGSIVSTQGTTQQMTTNITKKTESVKGASDAMHTENIQAVGVVGTGDEQNVEHVKGEKSNHKQKPSTAGVTGKETADLVIEPKSEYEEEGNEETVEDLTLDDEEMGIEDLDHNAGTSQAGEGSSQGYAPWQHDRSQDELLLAPQETQQRDPQGYFPSFAHSTNSTIIATNSNSNTRPSGATFTRPPLSPPQQQSLTANILIDNKNSNAFQNNPQESHDITIESTESIFSGSIAISSRYQILDNSEENYECPQCYRTYRRHGTLRRHLRQECGKGKSMVCSVCGHRTKRADHLRQHVRKKHPEMAMRSLFRRPTSAAGSSNHGIRTHGFGHRLPPQQRMQQLLQRSLSPPILPYSEIHGQQLQESLVATKALPFNATSTSDAASFMGVDVVDLDAEGDNNGDDNKKSDSDKLDLEHDKVKQQSRADLLGVTNVHRGKVGMIGNNTYHQQVHPQALYQLRQQYQQQRQQRVDAFQVENAE